MDSSQLTPRAHTPFADLDLLLAEAERDAPPAPAAALGDVAEPQSQDAFDAQILAGLVSP